MMKSMTMVLTAGAAAAMALPAQAAMLQYEITGATNVRFALDSNPVPRLVDDYPRQKNFSLFPVRGTTLIDGVATDVDLMVTMYDRINGGGMTVASGRLTGPGTTTDDWLADFRVWMSAETADDAAFFTGSVTAPTLITGGWTLAEYPADGSSYTLTVSALPTAAVPEPASWALMIGGVGLVGGALRRRSATATRVRFAA